MHSSVTLGPAFVRTPWGCGHQQRVRSPGCTTPTTITCASRAVRNGSARRCSTSAVSEKVSPMLHPPGPSILYPESNALLDVLFQKLELQDQRTAVEGLAAGYACGLPPEDPSDIDAVIETPPEWGSPDEGNPNQPRRVPEYQPPQEPVPGSPSTPEFDPPERSRPSPPVPEDDPMKPLPPQQPEIPPNERDPLKKAPEQMPGNQPTRRGDEQTQPQPGETSASAALGEDEEEYDEEDGPVSAEEAQLLYMQWCRENVSIEDLVEVYLADDDKPMVELTHPSGSTAQVYLHGANVVSWTNPAGAELLYLQGQGPEQPIQGGVAVCFPNFGDHHRLPTNGFLQDCHWELVESEQSGPLGWDPAPSITLFTQSDEDTLKIWPHHFEAAYSVQLMVPDDFPSMDLPNTYHTSRSKDAFGSPSDSPLGSGEPDVDGQMTMQLRLQLQVLNTGDEEMTFTTALQSHLATQDLANQHMQHAQILGLGGKHFLNFSKDSLQPSLGLETEDYVSFGKNDVSRVYVDSNRGDLKFCPGNQTHFEVLQRHGFQDLGVINRQRAVEQRTRENNHHVVLSTAQLARPVTIAPGESWVGEMALRWHDKYWELPLFEKGPQPGGISDQIMPGYENIDRKRQMPPLPRQTRHNTRA